MLGKPLVPRQIKVNRPCSRCRSRRFDEQHVLSVRLANDYKTQDFPNSRCSESKSASACLLFISSECSRPKSWYAFHKRPFQLQAPILRRAKVMLSFKLARTQWQLQSRKWLRGSMGEQRASMREHKGSRLTKRALVREHRASRVVEFKEYYIYIFARWDIEVKGMLLEL